MIWVITELYYPEETSTGHFLTKIAEGLADSKNVSVICSQPTYSQRGTKAPVHEIYNNVHIYRRWGGRLNKNYFLLRIVNFLTISISLFLYGLVRFKKGDNVIVVTNPPLLPYLVTVATRIKGCRSILLVHDVYPEVLTAAGVFRDSSIVIKLIQWLTQWLYDNVNAIVVIGRDMQKIAEKKCNDWNKIKFIPNWADLDEMKPAARSNNKLLTSLDLKNSFVIQYCGNMGRTHGINYIVEAATLLQSESFHFLLIGSGAKKSWLEKEVSKRNLSNMSILARCERNDLNDYLNACNLAVVSFVSGMSGVSVPSRMYNIMATGKPVLAISDEDSELAKVVTEEEIGWVAKPGEIDSIVEAIRDAKSDAKRLLNMGRKARMVAEEKYSFSLVLDNYLELLSEI